MSVVDNVVSVRLDDARDTLILLDQTLLPGETKYLELTTQQQIWDAIYRLQVRGAPAIGIAAAMTAAFKEFSAKKLTQEQKPSIRKLIVSLKEKAAALNAQRDKVKNKDRGIAR